jgi:lysophospholipase L1-like esterase
MRFLASLLFTAAAASLLPAAGPQPDPNMTNPTAIPASDPHIAYMGRVALAGGEATLGFPGITIRFVYSGPAPTLRLRAGSPNCYCNLACNGWDPVMIHLNPGENEIALPTGRAPAQGRLIELVRRNEAWQGIATFQGLVLPPGCELLPPPPWPERKLMFIGDSITGGEYLERFPPENISTPQSANAARAFGMLLGRWLHAQVHLVSYGGRGVMRDWQGNTDGTNAPQFFQRTLPDDPVSHWNHVDYVPDAIVVCLGANDFSKDLPDEATYTKAYDDFVGEVRVAYPHAVLLLAESPIFGDTPGTHDRAKRDQLRRTLEAVTARRRAAGDQRIVVASVHHYPGTPTNAHPVAFQHEQIAQELLGPIRALTGW